MKAQILDFLEAKGLGKRQINYKLRDWVFSRQRYWGEPIPIYFPVKTAGDPRSGAAFEIDYSCPRALAEQELPLRLPELEDYKPGDPAGPLAKALDWRFFQRDGEWFARETNTMPQWAGSCWYYLRYLDPKNEHEIFSQAAYDAWMPVDLYVGGSEHAVLHLMYARFWHKVLYDIGVVKHREPFTKLVHQGLILGMVYRWYAVLDAEGRLVRALAGDDSRVEPSSEGLRFQPSGEHVEARYEVESQIVLKEGRPFHAEHNVALFGMAEKMSKSRGNVVNPDPVIEEHGADSLRVYEMFMGPLEQSKPWQTSGILGCRRFLDRVHALATRELSNAPMDAETAKEVHRTVKRVTEHVETLRFNTAIAFMMELVKFLGAQAMPAREAIERLVLCVSPFAPHLAEELWLGLGHPETLSQVTWPSFDEALCVDSEVEMPVQINGKVRSRVRLAVDASESVAQRAALADETILKLLDGKSVKKLVYVQGRILNLIVG